MLTPPAKPTTSTCCTQTDEYKGAWFGLCEDGRAHHTTCPFAIRAQQHQTECLGLGHNYDWTHRHGIELNPSVYGGLDKHGGPAPPAAGATGAVGSSSEYGGPWGGTAIGGVPGHDATVPAAIGALAGAAGTPLSDTWTPEVEKKTHRLVDLVATVEIGKTPKEILAEWRPGDPVVTVEGRDGRVVEKSAGEVLLERDTLLASRCTLENCGHMRQLDNIVDLLGMTRGTRSVLDALRSREKQTHATVRELRLFLNFHRSSFSHPHSDTRDSFPVTETDVDAFIVRRTKLWRQTWLFPLLDELDGIDKPTRDRAARDPSFRCSRCGAPIPIGGEGVPELCSVCCDDHDRPAGCAHCHTDAG